MYQPPHFRNDDLPQIRALMHEHRFATLISCESLDLYATPLPTVTKEDTPYATVECHLARANPHWKGPRRCRRGANDFPGSAGLHHSELLSIEGRAREDRANLELRGPARLRSSRGDCCFLETDLMPGAQDHFLSSHLDHIGR